MCTQGKIYFSKCGEQIHFFFFFEGAFTVVHLLGIYLLI